MRFNSGAELWGKIFLKNGRREAVEIAPWLRRGGWWRVSSRGKNLEIEKTSCGARNPLENARNRQRNLWKCLQKQAGKFAKT
jgi:hypothetical protein